MTEQLTQSVKDALNAFEALKSDILPIKQKMDAFDAAKYDRIQESITAALEENQKLHGRMELMRKEQDALQAALNRPNAVVTSEDQAQALRKKSKKLFNDFARLDTGGRQLRFDEYVKEHVKDEAEYKAMAVNSDPNGGYLTTPDFGGIIQSYIYETSPMRQLCTVTEIGTDTLEVLLDNSQAAAYWAGETQTRPVTANPTLGKLMIYANELVAQPQVTQKLLDDAVIDVEAWLAGKVGELMARTENTAFVSGTGSQQPKGVLSYASGTVVSNQQIQQVHSTNASALTYLGLVNLQASLKEDYQANATFLIQRATIGNLLTITDGIGRPIFNMTFDKNTGLEQGIMGRPLRFGADVPAVSAGALAVIYGDFRRGYQIVDRMGVRVLRDPYSAKPNVEFYTTKRTGGAVVNFEALKLLVIAA